MITNVDCPNCKQPVPADAEICPNCGTSLQVQQQQQVPVQEQQEDAPLDELTQALPDVVKQLDASANINITIAGGLIAFYSGGIFAGKVISASAIYGVLYALPLCVLLAAIISALQVFYPRGYLLEKSYRALIDQKER